MPEPAMTALTVALILQTACSEFVKGSTGEAGKQLTASAIAKVKQLYQIIKARLSNDPKATEAIVAIEEGRTTDLKPLEQPLSLEMANDPDFAQQVRQLAYEIINIETVDGNVQNILQGDGYQSINNQGQTFQGVKDTTINIHNYPSAPPQH